MSFMNNRFMISLLLLILLPMALPTPANAQDRGADAVLVVDGDIAKRLELSRAALRSMLRATEEVEDKGATKTYGGVWLHELLIKAGTPRGDQLKGKALSTYVLASASDGYQAVFALAELDPGFRDDPVLVADQVDGGPLPSNEGPFRLIVPGDKRGARAVRMLERIEVMQLRK